ncbi:MAG TPA: hypothetical protein DEG06_00165 [Lachnospiraceae bacterium]|jgi:hypothetical protein|nr:hypothetical protein [Lachnospiraceae bacterium]HBY70636.1 hypothetical protein [Lachnospiraceae bacterium]HCA70168.1 hypothetical protein [Lachnospiraceae bacterium]HCM13846.1 hypothetical protein [Lachnospiraceae bacterium]HCR40608.1 hypothetical protein [Lachnospiraceae bacterium]
MKKLIALILGFAVLLSTSSVPVMAAEASNDFSVKYIACPDGGKHEMHSVGVCFIYSGPSPSDPGERIVSYGNTNQCSKCGLYVGAQYCPQTYGFLGPYTMGYNIEYAGSIYYFYDGLMGEYWSLTGDSFIDGFEWKF